jgi:hypothetical protein
LQRLWDPAVARCDVVGWVARDAACVEDLVKRDSDVDLAELCKTRVASDGAQRLGDVGLYACFREQQCLEVPKLLFVPDHGDVLDPVLGLLTR